ncbi:MAG: 16S rRNA processing protein RimM [Gammaproteobacteria bacterium]|nr:16S rRNA processing protein RimM [Gammaproteobacteria bacterium]
MSAPDTPGSVVLGRIGAPHGVRGWLRVQSYADRPEGLFGHQPWRLKFADGHLECFRVLDGEGSGSSWRVALEGVGDRDAAGRLTGCLIEVARSALPVPGVREHYRDDLVGYEVITRDGVRLGSVRGFVDAPANPVMVVMGDRERWLPAMPPHLVRVRAADREIDVDWPAEL